MNHYHLRYISWIKQRLNILYNLCYVGWVQLHEIIIPFRQSWSWSCSTISVVFHLRLSWSEWSRPLGGWASWLFTVTEAASWTFTYLSIPFFSPNLVFYISAACIRAVEIEFSKTERSRSPLFFLNENIVLAFLHLHAYSLTTQLLHHLATMYFK